MSFNSEQENFGPRPTPMTISKKIVSSTISLVQKRGKKCWGIPDAKHSIIEISVPAFEFVTARHDFVHAFNGPILDSKLESESFDLVFTMGVLIHINPEQLVAHMAKMFDYSRRYILIGEYFNRTPVTIEYQGSEDKLFKRDFGKLFLENFNIKLLDYGFLWGNIYDAAGFDDITWWLFEKQ
jgi:pseudaminic acid biosynthesis-associated methylase